MSIRAALIWAAFNFITAAAFWSASGSVGIWSWSLGCVFVGMALATWLHDDDAA